MGMVEDTRYIDDEIDAFRDRLVSEGMDPDLILACMLTAVAEAHASLPDGPALMADVYREIAEDMEAGRLSPDPHRPKRPALRVIQGGG